MVTSHGKTAIRVETRTRGCHRDVVRVALSNHRAVAISGVPTRSSSLPPQLPGHLFSWSMNTTARSWDAFVSHASEDKSFVRELVNALGQLGAQTWFDEFELKPGDSLVASIDRGLALSRHGVLVISPAFLGKPWTEYERRGLTSRQIADGNGLVPIWRGVTHADVAKLSPTLADQYAIVAEGRPMLEIALRVLSVISPPLFEAVSRRAQLDARLSEGIRATVPIEDLLRDGSPVRHRTLPSELLLRMTVVYQVFHDVFEPDWDVTVRSFQADLRPDREVAIWETMAAVFIELCRSAPPTVEARNDIFSAVLAASMDDFDRIDALKSGYVTSASVRDAHQRLIARITRYTEDNE
jgi:hypothetical protein